ncbi:MAG: type II toxin-antitoxin system VapC family toxin [Leptospiraceae bacterium]|nr:type II toxin-antitoxin system VapC family toxin [Leptospiraceae bacterium]
MIVYLDTSVLLRWLLNSSKVYSGFQKWDSCYTSELLPIEVNRVLNRLRLEKEIDDQEFANLHKIFLEFYNTISVIEINQAVKQKSSEPFSTVIGTLDAIHLASALLLKEENKKLKILFLTHDNQLSTAAIAMGFDVEGLN